MRAKQDIPNIEILGIEREGDNELFLDLKLYKCNCHVLARPLRA